MGFYCSEKAYYFRARVVLQLVWPKVISLGGRKIVCYSRFFRNTWCAFLVLGERCKNRLKKQWEEAGPGYGYECRLRISPEKETGHRYLALILLSPWAPSRPRFIILELGRSFFLGNSSCGSEIRFYLLGLIWNVGHRRNTFIRTSWRDIDLLVFFVCFLCSL